MNVRWLRRALLDLHRIHDYLSNENPAAASDVIDRIWTSTETLHDHPKAGRPGRVDGTRELVISGIPYIIAYREDGDEVHVLAVFHDAQMWPAEL